MCLGGKLRHITVLHILQNQCYTIVATITWYLWQLEWQHLNIFNLLTSEIKSTDDQINIMVHARTLIPSLQTNHHRCEIRTRTRHHTIATSHGKTLHLWNLLYLFLYLLHDLARFMKRCTLWSTNLSQDNSLVFLWYKTRRKVGHEEEQQKECSNEQCTSNPRTTDKLLNTLGILIVNGIVTGRISLLSVIGQVLSLRTFFLGFHHESTKGRT